MAVPLPISAIRRHVVSPIWSTKYSLKFGSLKIQSLVGFVSQNQVTARAQAFPVQILRGEKNFGRRVHFPVDARQVAEDLILTRISGRHALACGHRESTAEAAAFSNEGGRAPLGPQSSLAADGPIPSRSYSSAAETGREASSNFMPDRRSWVGAGAKIRSSPGRRRSCRCIAV